MTDYTRKINELAMKDYKPDHLIVTDWLEVQKQAVIETLEQAEYRRRAEYLEDYWKQLNNEYGI